jgi:CRP-like cAMP-binding protein
MNALKRIRMTLPTANNLLRALRPEDLDILKPHLHAVHVTSGQILYEPGDIVNYAYFPCNGTLVSFVVPLADARAVETALIGREGAVGGIVSEGHLPAYCRAIVQFSGEMLRVESIMLERAKSKSVSLWLFFARYADSLLAQVFQAVACNATHTIEQRTAKWLAAALDRTGELTVPLTPDQLAGMLGVGRSYVARVLAGMKADGTLETSRGKLRVHKKEDLEKIACNCNDLVRKHFDEVLNGVYPE